MYYTRGLAGFASLHKRLIDLHPIHPRYGNKAWTQELKWTGRQAFNAAPDQPWLLADGTQAGEARTAEGFTFLRVFGAGHMVPMDQPAAALALVNAFTQGKPFA